MHYLRSITKLVIGTIVSIVTIAILVIVQINQSGIITTAQAKTYSSFVIKPVARVNDQIITSLELEKKIRWFLIKSGQDVTQQNKAQAYSTVLNQAILEKLYLEDQSSTISGITNHDLNIHKDKIIQDLELGSNKDYDSIITDEIKASIALNNILAKNQTQIQVSKNEIYDYVRNLQAQPDQSELHLQLIFIPKSSSESENIKLVNKIHYQLQYANISFAEAYTSFSKGIITGPNGDIGWINPNILPIEIQKALTKSNLQIASYPKLLDPIPTPNGYYFVQVKGKRNLEIPKYTLVTYKVWGDDTAKTRKVLSKIKSTIKGCSNISKKLTHSTSVNWEQKTIFPSNTSVYEMLNTMELGSTTDILSNHNGIEIYMLCSFRQTPSFQQYQEQIKRSIIQNKHIKMIDSINQDLQSKANIHIYSDTE